MIPDHNHLPKPINRPTRTNHLNGWSTGWSFANPTLSGRIKKYRQTRTARPEPSPTLPLQISNRKNNDSLFCKTNLLKEANPLFFCKQSYKRSKQVQILKQIERLGKLICFSNVC